ncbi:MAG: hypothetical protein OEU26_00810 [Candidatus Tectomicrobia bacterium]|nr:hypothetical protein [Candidatus Tectomicrobia bacterium]
MFPTRVGRRNVSAATDEREHDAENTGRGYCRVVWSELLAFSLHVQVIDNAGGDKDFDTITVVGGRAQVTF